MYRLGLRLTLRSGKEAFARLLLIMAAVGTGVTILLAVFAYFHAFQVTNDRPSWQSTQGIQGKLPTSTTNAELWNYSNDIFKGQTIERLYVAALGSNAPVPPGISKLPGAGQYYVSPALAALIRSTPRNELGNRFPGTQIGTIGEEALTSPDELVIFVGYTPTTLATLSSTVVVDKIANGPQTSVWTNYFRYAFAIGAVAFVFPILIFISSATRLAAARREERYAVMRLVGATPHQINIIASVDAVIGALFGTVLGICIFTLLRHTLAGMNITSTRYFANDVTPTVWGYVGMLIVVPIMSAVAALLSLRRVQISPLGVSRKATPPNPKGWRIILLAVGIVLFVIGLQRTTPKSIGLPVFPGLILIMIGLVVGGPWLTAQAAQLLVKFSRSASSLLAARRLADNPKAAFRSVSGLVLAVFLGTVVAGLLPAINATTATPSADALSNVLLAGFTQSPVCGNTVNCTGNGDGGPGNLTYVQQVIASQGLPPQTGAELVRQLRKVHGATIIPFYSIPQTAHPTGTEGQKLKNLMGPQSMNTGIISCEGLKELAALGTCAPGVQAVEANTQQLSGDNPSYSTLPIAGSTLGNVAVPDSFTSLYLQGMLVKVNNATTLEIVRTFLTTHTPLSAGGSAPRTFGEATQAREGLADTVQRMVYLAVALTLFVAGCSLAVAVGGSMVERKRPFSLLRLSGTSTIALYKVVLMEAFLPLVTATAVAAGTAYGISVLTVKKMGPKGTPTPTLGHTYFLIMGTGLIVSMLVILVTLPLLGHITKPDDARFE